jgi:hypothetical protein
MKGKAALALSRDLDVQYKTAFVLAHKLREAMATEPKGMGIGGPGRTVETDSAYFGEYVKPANHKEKPARSSLRPQPDGQAPAYRRGKRAPGPDAAGRVQGRTARRLAVCNGRHQ